MQNRKASSSPIIIYIRLETLDPISGTTWIEQGEKVAFEGWLGLLDVLSKLIDQTDAADERDDEHPIDE